MTGAVSGFDPIAYISQINTALAAANKAAAAPSATPATPPPSNTISSTVLSLLQETSSSSPNGNLLSTVLGDGGSGVSSSNPLAGVYNTLAYNLSTAQPYQEALNAAQQLQTQSQATTTNPVQSVLNSYTGASNAYNKTLQQNAQAVIAANNFQADGKTPLVA